MPFHLLPPEKKNKKWVGSVIKLDGAVDF
uniref:Uncharacterized protein n=1 Tax=Arundo donax TaxID=35708 RepID=A0A0A9BX26_ARUDO